MVLLYFADIFGKPGRKAVRHVLPELKEKYKPDFLIGNAENLAGGKGINKRTFNEMCEMGFDLLTSGNHIWDNKEVLSLFETTDRILRPANFPEPPRERCPGRGHILLEKNGHSLLVINLMGRVFMDDIECPFIEVDRILAGPASPGVGCGAPHLEGARRNQHHLEASAVVPHPPRAAGGDDRCAQPGIGDDARVGFRFERGGPCRYVVAGARPPTGKQDAHVGTVDDAVAVNVAAA